MYGEGIYSDERKEFKRSPIHVFRRNDVTQARIILLWDLLPAIVDIAHIDLYFFYDIDIAILVAENNRRKTFTTARYLLRCYDDM